MLIGRWQRNFCLNRLVLELVWARTCSAFEPAIGFKTLPPPPQSGDRYGNRHERVPEFYGYGVDSDQFGFEPLTCPESKPGQEMKTAAVALGAPRKT